MCHCMKVSLKSLKMSFDADLLRAVTKVVDQLIYLPDTSKFLLWDKAELDRVKQTFS